MIPFHLSDKHYLFWEAGFSFWDTLKKILAMSQPEGRVVPVTLGIFGGWWGPGKEARGKGVSSTPPFVDSAPGRRIDQLTSSRGRFF